MDGVRQQLERAAPGQPPRLTVLSFAENSVDLARATRQEEVRSRDSRERGVWELLEPDPAEQLRPREIARFYGEAHQRMSSPLTALTYALVGLAVALTGQFQRHGGGFFVDAQAGITQSVGQIRAEFVGHTFEGHIFVVAAGGFGRRREDRLAQAVAFDQTGRQFDAADLAG